MNLYRSIKAYEMNSNFTLDLGNRNKNNLGVGGTKRKITKSLMQVFAVWRKPWFLAWSCNSLMMMVVILINKPFNKEAVWKNTKTLRSKHRGIFFSCLNQIQKSSGVNSFVTMISMNLFLLIHCAKYFIVILLFDTQNKFVILDFYPYL